MIGLGDPYQAFMCPRCGKGYSLEVSYVDDVTVVTFRCGHEISGVRAESYLARAFPPRGGVDNAP